MVGRLGIAPLITLLVLAATVPAAGRTDDGSAAAQIVFVSNRDGDRDVFATDPSGRHLRALTRNRLPETAGVSRDGRRLVITRARGARTELVSVTSDGRHERVLAAGKALRFAQFSPDGQWIAYSRGRDIEVVRIDGRARRVVARGPNLSVLDWSPDATHLLLRVGAGESDGDLETVARDGSSRRLIAHDVDDARWGTRWIAVVRNVGDMQELVGWEPDPAVPRFPLDRASAIRLIGWRRAGDEVAAISSHNGTESVAFWNLDSSRSETVLVARHVTNGAWSPSGDVLAITLPQVGADGEDIVVLAPFPWERIGLISGRRGFAVDSLAWSPDSTQLAFASGSRLYVAERDGTDRRLLASRGRPRLVGWASRGVP